MSSYAYYDLFRELVKPIIKAAQDKLYLGHAYISAGVRIAPCSLILRHLPVAIDGMHARNKETVYEIWMYDTSSKVYLRYHDGTSADYTFSVGLADPNCIDKIIQEMLRCAGAKIQFEADGRRISRAVLVYEE